MGLVYQEQLTVRHYECDRKGQMTLAMLSRILLHISQRQTECLNANKFMQEQQLTWFILQHDMMIYRLPRASETILIETEAVSYNPFFTHRRFKVSVDNELLVKTIVRFAVVDKIERRIVRITDDMIHAYQAEKIVKNPKLVAIERFAKCERPRYFTVHYTDIDSNQHVNNAVYFDWVWNSLPAKFLQHYLPTNVSIIYENEVLEDQQVEVYPLIDNQTTHFQLMVGDTSVARAKIEWQPITLDKDLKS